MFRKYLLLVVLLLIFTAVILTNLSFTKFLIGWDNLLPELNLGLNIKRAIFSTWQEYQGLGLLAGNGHAAELPRLIFIYLLSFIAPINLIRQIYVFTMLLTGALGVYFLIKTVFNKNSPVAFIGSLFYLLNLMTVQTFYVPFEPMITHYGFLPWLILSLIYFLENNTKKALFFFITINILAIPQGQVPTVFLVYLFVFAIILVSFNLREKRKELFNKSLKAIFLTFIINAFWLLPFLYFAITNSNVALDAKINQMATQTVILQNKAFGDIESVMLLKGFWFNNVDPDLTGKFAYMLKPWRDQLTNPFIVYIGYLFFAVILIGLISSIKTKKTIFIVMGSLFIFSFTMLATNTPPFSWIDSFLKLFPVFSEIFRFPFTKFGVVLLLCYAVFFAMGVFQIYSFLENRFRIKNVFSYLAIAIFSVLIIFFIFPVFKGELFYYKEKLSLPKEYLQTFDYFKTQDKNMRIANLPQPTFWGWGFYKWGYGGSGFLWYGIKQPILDRAFDVWSKPSENYYWELSNALYSKNPMLLKNVLNKYQVGFLLLDKNIINPPSPEVLMTSETEKLIAQIPEIKKSASFGNIAIYKVSLKDNVNNFIYTAGKLPVTNKYQWGNYDKAYATLGNYITDITNLTIFYPFRSLFSAKNQEDQEYSVKENGKNIEFSKKLTNINSETKLNISSFTNLEKMVYVQVLQNKSTNGTIAISLLIKTPEIFLTKKHSSEKDQKIKIWGDEKLKPIFIINQKNNYGFYVNINGVKSFKIEPFVYEGELGSTFLSTTQDNVIVLSNISLNVSQSFTLTKENIKKLLPETEIVLPKINDSDILTVAIPKIEDNYVNFAFKPSADMLKDIKNCDNFNNGPIKTNIINKNGKKILELSSINSTACFSPYSSTFTHDQGYIAFIESQNLKGRPLHFWLLNEDQKYAPIDTYFSSKNNLKLQNFIIQPLEEFGRAYSFHFDNISIEKDETVNTLGEIRIYPIPYNFLTSMVFVKAKEPKANSNIIKLSTLHPNESLYKVKISSNTNSPYTLILSQTFDNGWQAYEVNDSEGLTAFLNEHFPFMLGKKVKNHVLINNWENGWVIDNPNKQKTNLTIIYLPQYLEFLGFLLLPIASLFVIGFLKLKSGKYPARV
ncbi:MAG: hypothetical protein AAB702_01850 [Patescibacteria group bacterium]